MQRDTILIVEGGMMLGVFGGGVLTALGEANIYNRLHAVCGTSSGAHDCAYFLSRQLRLGSSIYYEDLAGSLFVNKRNFFKFIGNLVWTKIFKKLITRKVADLDYLIRLESTSKKLDVETIKNQSIHFYVEVFDIDSKKPIYIDGKNNTMQVLKATATAVPYYPWSVKIGNRNYIDGGVVRTKNFIDIIKRNPNKKIIYIINRRKTFRKIFWSIPQELFNAILVYLIFGIKIAWLSLKSIFNFPTLEELSSYPNVNLVVNDKPYLGTTTDREKLLEIYNHGIAKGKQALKKLN